MGFWRFNPPEPCCNPPAGWCQCQPCRWKITSVSDGPFLSEEEPGQSNGILASPLPVILRGATKHSKIKLNGGISYDGPPWFRMWRGLTTYQTIQSGISQGTSVDSWMVFWFGFAVWSLPDGWTPGLRQTFGLKFVGVTSDRSGHPVPQEEGPFSSFLFLHAPGLSPKWDCWGQNKLYFVGDTVGEFDTANVAIVEPDL